MAGLGENISLEVSGLGPYLGLITDTVKAYNALAVKEIQRAYDESFDETANMLLDTYLANVATYGSGDSGDRSAERDMREIERPIGVAERSKAEFRQENRDISAAWELRGWKFIYTSDPRLQAAIEARLFTTHRNIDRSLTQPRFARQRAEWARRRSSISSRLVEKYGYCDVCAEDLISYVSVVLKNKAVIKTPKNTGVEWLWPLNPGVQDALTPTT